MYAAKVKAKAPTVLLILVILPAVVKINAIKSLHSAVNGHIFQSFVANTSFFNMYCYCILLLFLTNPLYKMDFVGSFKFQDEADISVTTKKVLEFCKMNGKQFLTITTMDQENKQVCMFKYAAFM